MSESLLTVSRLALHLGSADPFLRVPELRIGPGESIGLLGPSGSGKSVLAATLVGLQPPVLGVRADRLAWKGKHDLIHLKAGQWQRIRGREIARIPQDPRAALNPVQTCGEQLRRAYRSLGGSRGGGAAAIERVLERVQLKGAGAQVQAAYPHQLSGGQLQRLVIAQALLGKPDLLIADEVTTALDAITTRDILSLLRRLHREEGMAMLFITHRRDLLWFLTERVLEIQDGMVVSGTADSVEPEVPVPAAPAASPPLLRLQGLRIAYDRQGGPVVRGLDLTLYPGERMALVGPSGCGKSTLASFLVGLLPAQAGTVGVSGPPISVVGLHLRAAALLRVQLIFQDVDGSLNPRHTVRRAIAEVVKDGATVARVLEKVGLPPATFAGRYPGELSGGEKQRVAIARALATDPELLICDEAFAALDAPLRLRLQDLLVGLSETEGLSVLLITHDLAQVRAFASRVAVMQEGTIVEVGTPDRLFTAPRTELSRQLVEAANFRGPRSGE